MPMQISLEEILSMLVSRVDQMAMANENMKSKFNIFARILYKKGVFTDEDIFQSVKEEHQLMLDLGAIKEMPDDEMIRGIADNIILWAQNDSATIKRNMQEYESKIKAMIEEEERKPRLDVASAADLQRLDRMSGRNPGGTSRLIVP